MNKIEEALNDADMCIKMQPEWFKGYHRKINALLQQKKISKAVTIYREAMNICDDNLALQVVHGLCSTFHEEKKSYLAGLCVSNINNCKYRVHNYKYRSNIDQNNTK